MVPLPCSIGPALAGDDVSPENVVRTEDVGVGSTQQIEAIE
jgi:hypothetical protein